jgi:endonuclease-3
MKQKKETVATKGIRRTETRLARIIELLEQEYGIPRRSRRPDPLESLIVTILSQNTNDINRDKAYQGLRERFPSWQEVLNAPEHEIAQAIRVGGLANIKSKRIKEILASIKREHGEFDLSFLRDLPPEEAERRLLSYKGVGLKTAKIVLLFTLGRNVFPVDTHIHRLSKRLGFVPENATREKTHEIMGNLVPPKKMYSFHLNLITHGRKTCIARKPRCPECVLNPLCPKIGVFGRPYLDGALQAPVRLGTGKRDLRLTE